MFFPDPGERESLPGVCALIRESREVLEAGLNLSDSRIGVAFKLSERKGYQKWIGSVSTEPSALKNRFSPKHHLKKWKSMLELSWATCWPSPPLSFAWKSKSYVQWLLHKVCIFCDKNYWGLRDLIVHTANHHVLFKHFNIVVKYAEQEVFCKFMLQQNIYMQILFWYYKTGM